MLNLLQEINLSNHQNELPKTKGIYFWLKKDSEEIVYIGIACNKEGLRKRISQQHLNPKYLEFRENKQTSKDEFQLTHFIPRISSNIIKKGIDKSSFRKSIGRKLLLKPGKETCEYILNNLRLKILVIEDVMYLKKLEKEMINLYKPVFNTSYKTTNLN